MKTTTEKFRKIKGFPSYQIGSNDSVRIKQEDGEWKYLKTSFDSDGYLRVNIKNEDGKNFYKRIHRLKLEAFKPRKNSDKLLGLHIDDDRKNNSLDNLKWGTKRDNALMAMDNGKLIFTKGKLNKQKVTVIDIEKQKVLSFDTMNAAAKFLNVSKTAIYKCCNDIMSNTKGYIVMYAKY